jgi:hypothetical protein
LFSNVAVSITSAARIDLDRQKTKPDSALTTRSWDTTLNFVLELLAFSDEGAAVRLAIGIS